MRFRRNERFELTAPESAPPEQDKPTIYNRTVLGIVVNPKTKEPLLAVTDGEYVGIRSLQAEDVLDSLGVGYHSESHEEASDVTGYPRVHTPRGVTKKGGGYGTALYTALCLGAYLTWDGTVKIGMRTKGKGISSAEEDRSRDASRWWGAAVDRGLAEREEAGEGEETEEHEHIDVDPDDLDRIVSLSDEGAHVTYVNDVDVDITKPGEPKIFDYYTWKSAQQHSLVVLAMAIEIDTSGDSGSRRRDVERIWRTVLDDPDLIYDLDQVALLALDVRGLDRDAVSLLELAYIAAGLNEKDVDDLVYRYEHGLDPDQGSPQQRLFPNAAHGMADVAAARQRTGWSELEDLP